MSDTMPTQLVTDPLMMAIWRRGKPDALLHHSNQGSQYTSGQFQRLMLGVEDGRRPQRRHLLDEPVRQCLG